MNGTQTARHAKPPPTGPTPPAPSGAPPVPPNHRQPTAPVNGTQHNHSNTTTTNTPQKGNKKKQTDPQADASQIYETLKSKIAALEEDAVHEEEEEKKFSMFSLSLYFRVGYHAENSLGWVGCECS